MKIDLKTALLLVAGTTALTACINEDDPVAPAPPPNEEEVITTMRLQFLSANGVEQKTFSFTDSDGPGGNPPVTVADTLTPDSTYAVAVLLLNETANPVDTVSHEVEEEGAVHQFFFQVGGANVEVDYSDADVNGNASHTYFSGLGGLNAVNLDAAGRVMSVASHDRIIAVEPTPWSRIKGLLTP